MSSNTFICTIKNLQHDGHQRLWLACKEIVRKHSIPYNTSWKRRSSDV